MQQQMQQIEALIRKLETMADPEARANALELVRSLMELHGSGIERMMEIVADAGESSAAVIDDFARDGLVGGLLLLYGLHPVPFETRVMQALDKARPILHAHGGDVELLGVDEGVVRLRLQGNCHGCASSALTLKAAIEEALYETAPDVVELVVDGLAEPPSPAPSGPALSGLVTLERAPKREHQVATLQ